MPDDELIPALKQQRVEGVHAGVGTKTDVIPVVKYSEVQSSYFSEVEKAGNWTEKTKAENLSIFALFVRVMGAGN